MVNIGDSFLQVIFENIENYYFIFWVLNDVVFYILVGDKVNICYEVFLVEKFGQFFVMVKIIFKIFVLIQEMLIYKGVLQNMLGDFVFWYKVIVMFEKQIIRYDEKYFFLENGMKVESILFLEKRCIYQWMFFFFYDMKYSVIGLFND